MPTHAGYSAIISAVSGLLLVAVTSAALGFIVAYKKSWPFAQIKNAAQIMRSLVLHGEVIGTGRRMPAPKGASREFATLHDPAAAIGQGHYALLGWDSARDAYSVFLLDAAGTHLHTWPIDEMSISAKVQHRQNAPHAMQVLPDGSLVVSFDKLGLMARLDPCGNTIWSREGFFHHSFSPAADGGIWTWHGEKTAYGQIMSILKFNPMTGKNIALLDFNRDVIMRSPESALIFSVFPDFKFTPDEKSPRDIFHPNDVEELPPSLAPAFPQFEAGDLMFSLRNLSMVAIIAPSGALKWYQQGPWIAQHDPDFEPDGRISVYNNSVGRPRSSIVRIDPKTRKMDNAIPSFDGLFKSEHRGKHQLLPNGNRLITIPEQGQAIEVAIDGDVVMEFNNVAKSARSFNEDLVNAKWLPADFFELEPDCSK